ncbi:MAG TPA: TetR/AcrR family transcriptional regulator [Vicinamibacterales bacterium]|nr:TetR/AcrR family transcriptional regulator [Vicinamibacterales bacterium]
MRRTLRASPRRKLSPRKAPRQDRSRATVEALLEAAADILVRHGYAKLTTNRIAERAGVNIASLYQYFPNKEAIVAELRRRHGADQRAAVRNALRERRGTDLESIVRMLVAMGVAAHAGAPELHRVFTEELPAFRVDEVSAVDPATVDEFRRFVRDAAPEVPDVELALWMVATIAGAVIHRAAVERPDDLRRGRITEELTTVLCRYLRRA